MPKDSATIYYLYLYPFHTITYSLILVQSIQFIHWHILSILDLYMRRFYYVLPCFMFPIIYSLLLKPFQNTKGRVIWNSVETTEVDSVTLPTLAAGMCYQKALYFTYFDFYYIGTYLLPIYRRFIEYQQLTVVRFLIHLTLILCIKNSIITTYLLLKYNKSLLIQISWVYWPWAILIFHFWSWWLAITSAKRLINIFILLV